MIIKGTRFLKPRKYLLSASRLIEKDSEVNLYGRRFFVTAADFRNAYKSRARTVTLKALHYGKFQEENEWKYIPFSISRRKIGLC